MSPGRAAIAIASAVFLLTGCTYYNAIYNADRLYEDGERLRRAGQDSTARERYLEVIRRTAEAYRARPESDWSGEALFLLGRSRLRLGELSAAQSAFREAEAVADDGLRERVRVYQAATLAARGGNDRALELVNDALSGGLEGPAAAEAHLLRGRLFLAGGMADQAWWDLDRASELGPDVRVEAGLERLRWAIRDRDRDRARVSLGQLLRYPEGGTQLDTVTNLVGTAARQWGPDVAAELLEAAGTSTWERNARGHVRLQRARFLHASGDTATASLEAWRVARGLGDASAEARILLAAWRLAETRDLVDVYAVRPILLPAGEHPRVSPVVDAIDAVELLTGVGLAGDPLGWFAAAEIARDELRADFVARGLFLAYADGAPEEPWAPKALLAALEVTTAEGDRAWLRGRLEGHDQSPYVRAAHGAPAAGFEALEEELEVRLREITGR